MDPEYGASGDDDGAWEEGCRPHALASSRPGRVLEGVSGRARRIEEAEEMRNTAMCIFSSARKPAAAANAPPKPQAFTSHTLSTVSTLATVYPKAYRRPQRGCEHMTGQSARVNPGTPCKCHQPRPRANMQTTPTRLSTLRFQTG